MDGELLTKLTLDFTDAFNRDDLDGVMGYFAETSIYDEFNGTRHHGRAAIRKAFEPQFRGEFGKIRFHQEDLFVDAGAGKAMISWTLSMEGDGRKGGWRGLDLLHFKDGKLVQKHTYAKTQKPLIAKLD